jgi:putative methionine-R-sulfoxide reductase with GAF domain
MCRRRQIRYVGYAARAGVLATGSVDMVMMKMAWGVCGRAKERARIVVESQAICKGS